MNIASQILSEVGLQDWWKDLSGPKQTQMRELIERLANETLKILTDPEHAENHEANILHLKAQVSLIAAQSAIEANRAIRESLISILQKVACFLAQSL